MGRILFSVVVLLMSLMISPITASAYTTANGNQVGVHDLAEVLADDEEESLYTLGIGYAEEHNLDIVFLTASDTNGKSSMVYSDDFYDGLEGDITYGDNGILVFVDLANGDPGEGYDYVNTVGRAIEEISDWEIERILDAAFEVPAEDYYGRLQTMMIYAIKMYEDTGESQSVFGSYNTATDIEGIGVIISSLLVIGVVAAIPVIILIAKHNKANKQVSASIYLDSSKSSFSKINSRFIRSYNSVDRGYYSRSSSSSSGSRSRGGSSHRSSSGRSHGGGGRRR